MNNPPQVAPPITRKFGLFVLAFAAIIVAGPLWWPGQTIAEDDALLYFPFLYRPFWDALWNPMVSGGVPQLANPQTGVFYPLAWLLGVDYFKGLAPYLSIHFFMAGSGLFLFARSHINRGLGPLLAGLVYGCGGAAFSLATKLDKMPGYALLPWVLLGLTWVLGQGNARERGVGWLVSAGGVALIALGGSIEGLPTVFLAAFAWFMLLQGHEGLLRRGGLVLLPLILGVILASILLVPFAYYLPESNRGGALSAAAALNRSLHPFDLVSFVWPGAFWGEDHHSLLLEGKLPKLRFLYGRYGGAFFSFLVLLGVGGAFKNKRRLSLRALLVAGIFCFLALGAYNPVYVWMQANLPVFSSMRFPEKWWLGALPFVCFLGAVGFDHLWALQKRTLVFAIAGLLFLTLLGVGAVFTQGRDGALEVFLGAIGQGGIFLGLCVAVVLALRTSRLKPALGIGLLVIFMTADLAIADGRIFWIFQVDEAFGPSPSMLAIEKDWGDAKGIPFVWDDTAHRGLPLPPAEQGLGAIRLAHNLAYENTGMNHGLAYLCGSLALRPGRQADMLHLAMKLELKHRHNLLKNAGLVYWILWDMNEGLQWINEFGFRPVPEAPGSPLRLPVLADRTPVSPLRWASEGRVAKDKMEVFAIMSRGLSPDTLVLSREAPGLVAFQDINLKPAVPSAYRYAQERSNIWRADYSSPEDGALILAQSWVPGWRYSVDNGPFLDAPRVNYALVGAPAPKGKHSVVLRYMPAGIGLGFAISLLALMALLAIAKNPPKPELTHSEQPA